MNLSKEILTINTIVKSQYVGENPEKIRSRKFGNAFAKMLRKMFPNYTIIPTNCYCEASGFIKNGEKYIYYSTWDYRYKSWQSQILYRVAKNDHDFQGGPNNFADLEDFELAVNTLFNKI